MHSASVSPLLRLPRELRDYIWELTLGGHLVDIIEGGIFEEIAHLSFEDLTHSICQVQEGFEEVFSIGKMAKMTGDFGMDALHL